VARCGGALVDCPFRHETLTMSAGAGALRLRLGGSCAAPMAAPLAATTPRRANITFSASPIGGVAAAQPPTPPAPPQQGGPAPRRDGAAMTALKRDWLTGGFVPAHGGIGSFLPVVKPRTPRVGQPRPPGGGTQNNTAERHSSSRGSDRSSRASVSSRGSDSSRRRSRASVSSRGSDGSRSSARSRAAGDAPFDRFSGNERVSTAPAGATRDRVPGRLSGRRQNTEEAENQVNLRYMLSLNSNTQERKDLDAAIPEFLRTTLNAFGSIGPRPEGRAHAAGLGTRDMSQTAKELLNDLDQVQWVARDHEEEGAFPKHPRIRIGLMPTLEVARSIGLRDEMETCAAIVLQACTRSHIAMKERRLKRQVALWGQKCYRRVRTMRYDRARRMEMEDYERRIAQVQYNMRPEEYDRAERMSAQARKVKQQKWSVVDDRFQKFKAQQDREEISAREELRARDRERKRAEVESVKQRLADQQSTFLTDAKRTVWVGAVPLKYATEHILRPLMEFLGEVVSLHIRVKKDLEKADVVGGGGSCGKCWALVMFARKEDAERSYHPDVREKCGLGVTHSWKFSVVTPEKIHSLKAKTTLAEMQTDNLNEDLAIRRQLSDMDREAKAEARQHLRAEQERRTAAISETWQVIDRELRTHEEKDRTAREMKKKREELKLHQQLLTIILGVWRSCANARTRLNALNKTAQIKQKTAEIQKLMEAGEIPLGKSRPGDPTMSAAPAVGNDSKEHGDSSSPGGNSSTGDGDGTGAGNSNGGGGGGGSVDLLKWNPTLYVYAMNAFYSEQRTLIRSFVSWKLYMEALLTDTKMLGQYRKAIFDWGFYLQGARDFGIKMKLDRIDGLMESPSIHEWMAPSERHERNLATTDGALPGSKAEYSSDSDSDSEPAGSGSNSTTEEGDRQQRQQTTQGDTDDDSEFTPRSRSSMRRSLSYAPSASSSSSSPSSSTSVGQMDNTSSAPPLRMRKTRSLSQADMKPKHRPRLAPPQEGVEEQETEGESERIRWSSAEEDLLGSLFPGALS
jgi:uncharacterized membrane protein YgcG